MRYCNPVIIGSLLLASQLPAISAYFYPSVLLPLTVGPGAWIGIYGLIGIKMVYILAVLSLSRIEYLFRIERQFGEAAHPDPRIALMAVEQAYHGLDKHPALSHFGWKRRKRNRHHRKVKKKLVLRRRRPRLRQRPASGLSIYGSPLGSPVQMGSSQADFRRQQAAQPHQYGGNYRDDSTYEQQASEPAVETQVPLKQRDETGGQDVTQERPPQEPAMVQRSLSQVEGGERLQRSGSQMAFRQISLPPAHLPRLPFNQHLGQRWAHEMKQKQLQQHQLKQQPMHRTTGRRRRRRSSAASSLKQITNLLANQV